MTKTVIRDNFSRSASTYDRYSRIQRLCASLLLEISPAAGISKILEVGCGTGTYTALLAEKYPDAEITAVDISADMIRVARERLAGKNVEFVVADAEALALGKRYDLVTSNASLQWMERPDVFMESAAASLSPGGSVSFSIYGPETFCELESVLVEKIGKGKWLEAAGFRGISELEKIFDRYFHGVSIAEEQCVAEFQDILSFIRDVRLSGTRGRGLAGRVFFGRERLKKLEEAYRERFGRIKATHQVFFVRAHSPKHAAQTRSEENHG